ncbi:MAG: manganese efflux pump MntP family protein [Oscillospiraceae bacterium]|nr:manganese efflux pump MntP family protein [Oscillospiraceae bacterium]
MLILLALSLGIDAFAVAVSCGISVPNFRKRFILWLAFYFGLFQAGMTMVGAIPGDRFGDLFGEVGRIVAFLLLAIIGGQMVWSALRKKEREEAPRDLTHRRMLLLAVAVSIDALAAGVSLGLQHANILLASGIIGGVAFALSILGGLFGERVGPSFHRRAGLVGGLVLIALGVRSLLG